MTTKASFKGPILKQCVPAPPREETGRSVEKKDPRMPHFLLEKVGPRSPPGCPAELHPSPGVPSLFQVSFHTAYLHLPLFPLLKPGHMNRVHYQLLNSSPEMLISKPHQNSSQPCVLILGSILDPGLHQVAIFFSRPA